MKKLLISIALLCNGSLWAAGYGSGGCGGGSMLIGADDGMVQIFAATTNGTSFSKYFGLSSGTSNCAEDGVVMSEKEKEFFAEANYESLIQQMAQGKGEHLFTFANLHGCYGEQATQFSDLLQKNYSEATLKVDSQEAHVLLENVGSLMHKNELTCSAL